VGNDLGLGVASTSDGKVETAPNEDGLTLGASPTDVLDFFGAVTSGQGAVSHEDSSTERL
jgi:hypothetical protein